jgi:CHASE3 domain sensor protein
MKSNWTLGQKLGISFGILIVLLLGLGISSIVAIGSLQTSLDTTGTKSTRKIELYGVINTAESDMAAEERGMIIFSMSKQTALADAAERKFQENAALLKRSVQEARDLAILAESKGLLTGIDRLADEWTSNLSQVSALLRAGNGEEAIKLSNGKDTLNA